jgi:hypothetical protein
MWYVYLSWTKIYNFFDNEHAFVSFKYNMKKNACYNGEMLKNNYKHNISNLWHNLSLKHVVDDW